MASARKIRRRMSVDDANADLLGHVHQTIDRLTVIWDQVSMDSATREKRVESAYALFYGAMNEIVANEEEMIKGVFEEIEKDSADVAATREELGLPTFPVDNYTPNSIALLKALGKEKKSLEERKMQAMFRQLEEFNGLVKLCRCLGEPTPEIESINEKIMPKTKVDEMAKQRLTYRKELEERRATLADLLNKANRRYSAIKNITLAREESDLLSMDLDDPNMIFSSEVIQKFNELLDKFEAEYEKWRENVIFQYIECYSELSTLSEKCYAVALLESYPEVIDLDVHDESLLLKLRADLEKLRERYESGKELFDKFAQWHLCFKKQEEIEAELNTDRVRKNRGGCMTKVLADQKKNNAKAEHFLKELKSACENFSDLTVTIDNLSPYQFALYLVQDREQQKENTKEQKKMFKANQLLMESRFGTAGSPSVKSAVAKSVVTPSSRTPLKTPLNPSRIRTPGAKTNRLKTPIVGTPSRKRLNAANPSLS